MSVYSEVNREFRTWPRLKLTNIKKNCTIKSLVYDMVLEDFIVESLWSTFSSRHFERLANVGGFTREVFE
jgi:hypothetical protein